MVHLFKNTCINLCLISALILSNATMAGLLTSSNSVEFNFATTANLDDSKKQTNNFFLSGFDDSLGELQEVRLSLDSFLGLAVDTFASGLKTCTGKWGCGARDTQLKFSSEVILAQNVWFDLLSHDPNELNSYGTTNSVNASCSSKVKARKGETVIGDCNNTDGNAFGFQFDLTSADFDINLTEFIGGTNLIEIALTNQINFLSNSCDVGRNSQCRTISNLNGWSGDLSITYFYQ